MKNDSREAERSSRSPKPAAAAQRNRKQRGRSDAAAQSSVSRQASRPEIRRGVRRGSEERADADTSWNEVASWYDQHVGDDGSEYHRQLILPGVERLLRFHRSDRSDRSDLADMQVLDLACGQGVLCRYLAERGCRIVGADLAPQLLQRAQQRSRGDARIRYVEADATRLLDEADEPTAALEPESFDAVTLVLAVQNMTPLSPIWRGVAKLLKPGGALIIVMMHPAFRIPQRSDWHWNEARHRQERSAWSYLSSEAIAISAHPGQRAAGVNEAETVHFHRPLQAYLNTLGNAGLWIDHIEEWCSHKREQKGMKSEALDRARKEFPLFLALRARKVVL